MLWLMLDDFPLNSVGDCTTCMLGGEGANITNFFQERSPVMVVVTVLQILIH
jgi:hypothetical protein